MANALANFVAPLPFEKLTSFEMRQHLPLQHGKSDADVGSLFSWSRLIELAHTVEGEDQLRVSANRHMIPLSFLQIEGKTDAAKLQHLIGIGASIIVQAAHRWDKKLGNITQEYTELSGDKAWLGAIGSTGQAGAGPRHADPYDIFILQIEGEKHWRIYDKDTTPDDPIKQITLRAGDYLYVPMGHPHECDTVAEHSLHLGLGMPVSGEEITKSGLEE